MTKAPIREPFRRVVPCSYEVLLSKWVTEGPDGVEATAQGTTTRAQDADGDAPFEDEYVRVEEPAWTGSTAATKPETIANAVTKPEVTEDVYLAPKDPEKGEDNGVAGGTSKEGRWSLFWESIWAERSGGRPHFGA